MGELVKKPNGLESALIDTERELKTYRPEYHLNDATVEEALTRMKEHIRLIRRLLVEARVALSPDNESLDSGFVQNVEIDNDSRVEFRLYEEGVIELSLYVENDDEEEELYQTYLLESSGRLRIGKGIHPKNSMEDYSDYFVHFDSDPKNVLEDRIRKNIDFFERMYAAYPTDHMDLVVPELLGWADKYLKFLVDLAYPMQLLYEQATGKSFDPNAFAELEQPAFVSCVMDRLSEKLNPMDQIKVNMEQIYRHSIDPETGDVVHGTHSGKYRIDINCQKDGQKQHHRFNANICIEKNYVSIKLTSSTNQKEKVFDHRVTYIPSEKKLIITRRPGMPYVGGEESKLLWNAISIVAYGKIHGEIALLKRDLETIIQQDMMNTISRVDSLNIQPKAISSERKKTYAGKKKR